MDRRRQSGAALLIVMLIVLVAATAVVVSRLDAVSLETDRLRATQAMLGTAREALLDYAAARQHEAPDGRALFPCPDIDASGPGEEGEAHADVCGGQGVTVMGRLPWRTLGIAPPRDASGTCLWYVVSGSHKDATGALPAMLNPDSTGQLALFGIGAAGVIEGTTPADRPLAMVVAPMQPLAGQSRSVAVGTSQCSPDFAADAFLDADADSGLDNATLLGIADSIDLLATSLAPSDEHNDRVTTITRADLARRIRARHDFDAGMRELGLAVAACVAHYASNNPGGSDDRRLPWPAALALPDYRPDASYDDVSTPVLSGRLPDLVDDSNALTGNPIGRILSDCDPVAVPLWTAAARARWQNFKDHFFYAVAESFAPPAAVPSNCTSCLTVNGGGDYAAVIAFGGERLQSQSRSAPPIDSDMKRDPGNYLDSSNAANFPLASGSADFESGPVTATFNDRLFCIDSNLDVTEC